MRPSLDEIFAAFYRPKSRVKCHQLCCHGVQRRRKQHVPHSYGGYGTQFDAARRFNHLFDPANGGTSWRYLAVSVKGSKRLFGNSDSRQVTWDSRLKMASFSVQTRKATANSARKRRFSGRI
jgi:hypothetical protein